MTQIWTMGEMIVEIMRAKEDCPLDKADVFMGPYASGAPAIFIDTVAKLGVSGGIIGAVGADDFGKCIVDKLKTDGADCSLVTVSESLPTGSAFVMYDSQGDRRFIFHIAGTAATIPEAVKVMPAGAKFFHIMGCSLTAEERFGNRIIETMEVFLRGGAKITFDPNIRPELLKNPGCMNRMKQVLEKTSIFMPGRQELLQLTDSRTVERAVDKCFKEYPMEMVVMKNGSEGSVIFTKTGGYRFGICKVDVKDPTGAGDSFDGAFLAGLVQGKSVRDAAIEATVAAALNTAAFGPMEGDITPESVARMKKEYCG